MSLADYPDKALVLLVAGRKSYAAAYAQAVRLATEWRGNDKIITLVVADLGGVPSFVKGAAEEAMVKSHSEAAGRLPAGARLATLLDWEGLFARQLDIVGESNDVYLLYLVDRRGQIVLQVTQKVNDLTEEQLYRMTLAAAQKAQGR